MESIGVAKQLDEQFPGSILEILEHRGQVTVLVDRDVIFGICQLLKEAFGMNHLNCLCGVDNSTRKGSGFIERFEVVYQLYSIDNRVGLRIKAQIPESDPSIDSVTSLWTGANWLERETFDLVGISFNSHPNLRRILTTDDWPGHPLQKDYPLRGDTEWAGFTELKKKSAQLSKYDFYSREAEQEQTDD